MGGSPDIMGLLAEADTLEELVIDLRSLVLDLLELNHGIDRLREKTKIIIPADQSESLQPV
jgi:hypothetical protein